MRQSSAPTASSIVKAAAILMAVPTLLVPMKAAAQQMAANTTVDYSRCDRMAENNPVGATRCRVEVLQAIGAKADVRIARAEDGVACAKFLISKKAEGVSLDPTRLNREKGCIYARELGMQ